MVTEGTTASLEIYTRTRNDRGMPQALLIGGPLHGKTREVSGDRCTLIVREWREPGRMLGPGWSTPERMKRETAVYVRCEAEPRVYVSEGYLPTPDDVQLVTERLAG